MKPAFMRPKRAIVSDAEQKRKNQATMNLYAALSDKPEVQLSPVAEKRTRRTATERGCPTEHQEQVAVIHWWRRACGIYGVPESALFAIPNGGSRGAVEAANLKAEGVRAGVPDLFLSVPRGGCGGLFIEMKAMDGRPSPDQVEWIASARQRGYAAEITKGADLAIRVIKDYLGQA